ncbi:MAG TPA: helix-turn-helix domain-containing protein [Novosphingobium sp.]|nr:helix-turn-helix domain-containing protein [Novosphingobium sp.]
MADFALLALPGAYLGSVGALTDCFGLARGRVEQMFAGPDRLRMQTRLHRLSADGAPVVLADGMVLPVDGAIGSQGELAFIWLPAFVAGGRRQMEERIARNQPLLAWLRARHAAGATIGASGAAALLLMAAGLTDKLAVPVPRVLQPLARALFPRQPFEDRLQLVDRGTLLFSGGIGHDLALIVRVMERSLSPAIARWLVSVTGLDGEEGHLLADDQLVARAQVWIEQHFAGPLNLADLAANLSTSTATLNRRFHRVLGMPPKAYVQQLRLEAATRMLEKSDRPIDRIAEMLGFSDSRLFRAMFRQHTGMTASQWRAAHRAQPA